MRAGISRNRRIHVLTRSFPNSADVILMQLKCHYDKIKLEQNVQHAGLSRRHELLIRGRVILTHTAELNVVIWSLVQAVKPIWPTSRA